MTQSAGFDAMSNHVTAELLFVMTKTGTRRSNLVVLACALAGCAVEGQTRTSERDGDEIRAATTTR
jgi:hypothetical protein